MKTKRRNFRHRLAVFLSAKDGETLVETLVSTLIVVAVFLMLATAVVSAARINAKAKAQDTSFDASVSAKVDNSSFSLTVGGKDASKDAIAHEQNGYIYYDHQ